MTPDTTLVSALPSHSSSHPAPPHRLCTLLDVLPISSCFTNLHSEAISFKKTLWSSATTTTNTTTTITTINTGLEIDVKAFWNWPAVACSLLYYNCVLIYLSLLLICTQNNVKLYPWYMTATLGSRLPGTKQNSKYVLNKSILYAEPLELFYNTVPQYIRPCMTVSDPTREPTPELT